MTHLSAKITGTRFVGFELLPDDGEVGLVRGEPEHDQVRVRAAQHMLRVRVVVGAGALPPDVVHDLVLALARHVGVGQDHLRVLPARVVIEPKTIANANRHLGIVNKEELTCHGHSTGDTETTGP